MVELPVSIIEMIDESDASPEVAELFAEVKRDMSLPIAPNLIRAQAAAPNIARGTWEAMKHLYLSNSLPLQLKAMILYAIANANECEYCSAVHGVTCKSVGVDEKTLDMLTNNLSGLEPRRAQAIVNFAVQVARDPHNLTEADYDAVRDQGIEEEELVEIIGLAAIGSYFDIIADAFKIPVDDIFKGEVAQ